MDDLSAMINQVMSDPDSMRKIADMAKSLGITDNNVPQQPPLTFPPLSPPPSSVPGQALPNIDMSSLAKIIGTLSGSNASAAPIAPFVPTPPVPPAQPPGGLDLSSLASLLNQAQSTAPAPAPPPPQPSPKPDLSGLASLLGGSGGGSSPPDLSALSGLLGGLMGGASSSAQQSPQPHSSVGALTSMLGGPSQGASASGGSLLGFDMNILLKLQQAMSVMNANQENMKMLLALKGHLKTERAKKVDDAIRVMQIVQFLPLLKESGIFASVDDFLSKFSLGGLLNSPGNAVSNILDGLGFSNRR